MPVDDGNRRRVRAPAPLRVAGEERRQHRVDRVVVPDRVPLAELRHHPQPVEDLRQFLGVSQACRRFGVVLGEVQGVGQKERVEAGSGARRLVPRVDRRQADLRVGHSELVQKRPRGHRRLGDSLASRGDCFRRGTDPLFVLTRQEEGAQEWTVQTISEGELLLAERGGKLPAGVGAHLVRAQERAPLGREIHHCCLGAPVNPDVWPIPSISSHRGQDCDGRPFSARSMTSSVIFSTTCEK